jgi:hypothetical protein
VLHRLLLLQKRQQPQRRKRRRPPRLDWCDIASILGAPTVTIVRSSL